MKLSLDIPIPRLEHGVDYYSRILLLGSCFASNVGERFKQARFDVDVNPFGVLFNPYSVLDSMERIVQRKHFTSSDFFESDGRYLSLSLHSDHSYPDVETALRQVNGLVDTLHEKAKEFTHVFYTFGTAEVFCYLPTGEICANCHKISQKHFSKERMTAEEIAGMARRVEALLRTINPDVMVIYTVSPVRYLSEGALGNSASKGTLFCAIEELTDGKKNVYLPAYEVVMDELRDYRFFGDDMVHPNALAVEYLWQKIGSVLFSADTRRTIEQVMAIVRDAAHRPFNPEGEQYRRFCRSALDKIAALRACYPRMDFSREERFFREGDGV